MRVKAKWMKDNSNIHPLLHHHHVDAIAAEDGEKSCDGNKFAPNGVRSTSNFHIKFTWAIRSPIFVRLDALSIEWFTCHGCLIKICWVTRINDAHAGGTIFHWKVFSASGRGERNRLSIHPSPKRETEPKWTMAPAGHTYTRPHQHIDRRSSGTASRADQSQRP